MIGRALKVLCIILITAFSYLAMHEPTTGTIVAQGTVCVNPIKKLQ